MGEGDLAVINASDGLANLANLNTATESNGFVYYDKHTRSNDKRLAGDPPQIELIFRMKLDCKAMSSNVLSFTSRNFHTLKNAESTMRLDEAGGQRAITRDSPDHDICTAMNSGRGLFFSLTQNHYFEIQSFPSFALSYKDAIDIEEVSDSGEITRVSESRLLQYLRENNHNF